MSLSQQKCYSSLLPSHEWWLLVFFAYSDRKSGMFNCVDLKFKSMLFSVGVVFLVFYWVLGIQVILTFNVNVEGCFFFTPRM